MSGARVRLDRRRLGPGIPVLVSERLPPFAVLRWRWPMSQLRLGLTSFPPTELPASPESFPAELFEGPPATSPSKPQLSIGDPSGRLDVLWISFGVDGAETSTWLLLETGEAGVTWRLESGESHQLELGGLPIPEGVPLHLLVVAEGERNYRLEEVTDAAAVRDSPAIETPPPKPRPPRLRLDTDWGSAVAVQRPCCWAGLDDFFDDDGGQRRRGLSSSEPEMCLLCCQAPVEVRLEPCGHSHACESCAQRIWEAGTFKNPAKCPWCLTRLRSAPVLIPKPTKEEMEPVDAFPFPVGGPFGQPQADAEPWDWEWPATLRLPNPSRPEPSLHLAQLALLRSSVPTTPLLDAPNPL